MKRSLYSYFFDVKDLFVGYSYLSDDFVAFPESHKNRVLKILDKPNVIYSDADIEVYKKLQSKKILISESFEEYKFLQYLHRKYINRTDILNLTIIPTMACNCRCPYCFELHPPLSSSYMNKKTADNIINVIKKHSGSLKHLSISWYGGEPLYCMDIIKYITDSSIKICKDNDIGFSCSAITNGLLLSKKNIAILDSIKLTRLQITLDGHKEKHDKTRLRTNGMVTYNKILENMINYLNYSSNNNITLRIHFEGMNNELDKILSTLEDIPPHLRAQINPYFHYIFTEYTESYGTLIKNNENKKETISSDVVSFNDKMNDMGFRIGENIFNTPEPISCTFDMNNTYAIDPDGYVLMCTNAVEQERAIGKLTPDGIAYNYNRFFRATSKEYNSLSQNYCIDCKYLPFCWHKCTVANYQNSDSPDFLEKKNCKNKHNWYFERHIQQIKNRFLTNY